MDVTVVAHTASGSVRGVEHDGVSRFLGVPYAAAPFGDLRMRPPAPTSWRGIRDATAFGPTAPKGDYPPPLRPYLPEQVIAGAECLNLNIWTPAGAAEGSLPVLVWIHGGAFVNGSGSVTTYDGTSFARSGVVCVTINYRLGAEGFLFTEADLGSDTVNLGLQDQIAALRWVQENIGAFGGDPARVTVAGESAGAMSITALMAMPTAKGLFAQAITQSGAAANTITIEQGLMVSSRLASALGVEATREAIAGVEIDTVVAAVADMVTEVQMTPDVVKWGELALRSLPFAPVLDGAMLPRHPLEACVDGVASEVRVLLGTNSQEGRLFAVATGAVDEIDEAALAAGAAAYGASPEVIEAYRRKLGDGSPGDVFAQIAGDWYFLLPALEHAEAREKGGGTTWAYRFDRPLVQENNRFGAAHTVETPFVFNTIDKPELARTIGSAPSRAVAKAAHEVWVRFVRDGDPGWPPYTGELRTTGVITDQVSVINDPDGDLRASWESIR